MGVGAATAAASLEMLVCGPNRSGSNKKFNINVSIKAGEMSSGICVLHFLGQHFTKTLNGSELLVVGLLQGKSAYVSIRKPNPSCDANVLKPVRMCRGFGEQVIPAIFF